MIGSNLDTCRCGPPLIKVMGYEHREDEVGGGGTGNAKHQHTHTHTHTHTHSVPSDTLCGRSIGQGSNTIILTHVGLAPH